jgi:hypothetical protein
MTAQPADQRSPSYASLRPVADSDAAGPGRATAASTTPPLAVGSADNPYWRQEAEKLDALLQSLWSGYLEAPSNGLPSALADYVAAYTAAMRLKLMLMGYVTTQRRNFKTAAPLNGKVKTL